MGRTHGRARSTHDFSGDLTGWRVSAWRRFLPPNRVNAELHTPAGGCRGSERLQAGLGFPRGTDETRGRYTRPRTSRFVRSTPRRVPRVGGAALSPTEPRELGSNSRPPSRLRFRTTAGSLPPAHPQGLGNRAGTFRKRPRPGGRGNATQAITEPSPRRSGKPQLGEVIKRAPRRLPRLAAGHLLQVLRQGRCEGLFCAPRLRATHKTNQRRDPTKVPGRRTAPRSLARSPTEARCQPLSMLWNRLWSLLGFRASRSSRPLAPMLPAEHRSSRSR